MSPRYCWARNGNTIDAYLEAEPPEAVAAVRESRIDLAITFSYPGDREDPHGRSAEGLAVTTLCRDEMRLVLPPGHPLGRRKAVDLGELAHENWIGGCPRCRGHLMQLCDRRGFLPRISCETDNVPAVLGMVAAGLGVTILPGMALESVGLPRGVTVHEPQGPAGGDARTVHVVTAQGAQRIPALAATLHRLSVVVASAVG